MHLTVFSCANNSQLSDLSPLRGMPLTNLSCGGTNVADLALLQAIPTLTVLKVRVSKVTSAGVAALQKALPNCKIEWDDPAAPSR
jgi:hypothetical protein